MWSNTCCLLKCMIEALMGQPYRGISELRIKMKKVRRREEFHLLLSTSISMSTAIYNNLIEIFRSPNKPECVCVDKGHLNERI